MGTAVCAGLGGTHRGIGIVPVIGEHQVSLKSSDMLGNIRLHVRKSGSVANLLYGLASAFFSRID